MPCQLVRVLIAQRDANSFQPAVAMQQDMGWLTAEPLVLPWLLRPAPRSTVAGLSVRCSMETPSSPRLPGREMPRCLGCWRVWFRLLPGAKQTNPQVLVIHLFPCFALHALHCDFQHRAAAAPLGTPYRALVAVMKSFHPLSLQGFL